MFQMKENRKNQSPEKTMARYLNFPHERVGLGIPMQKFLPNQGRENDNQGGSAFIILLLRARTTMNFKKENFENIATRPLLGLPAIHFQEK